MNNRSDVDVLSGTEYLAEDVQEQLSKGDWPATAPRLVYLDRPVGWVLLEEQFSKLRGAAVATDNPCPEYRRELVSADPAIIVPGVTARLIRASVEMPPIPPVSAVLSPAEGKVLKLVAEGKSNKEIAIRRETSEGVVENALHAIYQKLNLRTRVDLVHYFYGLWHLLSKRKRV